MNFVTCENPKIIKNKYTDEKVSVPCGKCSACRNAKVAELVNRLDFESSFHRYTYFITLTYDDEHLPKAKVSKLGNETCVSVDFDSLHLDVSEELVSDLSFASHDVKVFSEKAFSFGLSVVKKADFQNFIKNIRQKVFRTFGEVDSTGTSTKIRYFAVSEYGKKHLRVHWHGLLWFDSSEVRRILYKLISTCWSFGRFDVQIVNNGATNYVAKYINSVSIYPQLYNSQPFKSARLSSKLPAVGVPEQSTKAFREYFYSCACTFIIKRFDKLAVSLFPQSYSDRWFPRYAFFDSLTKRDKLGLTYFAEQVDKRKSGFNFVIEDEQNDVYTKYLCVVSPNPMQLSDKDKRLYYVSRRICQNAKDLNLSLSVYLDMIVEYYKNRSLYFLKLFYEFQEDFARAHPHETLKLLCLYPVRCMEFRERLRNNALVEYDFDLLRMFQNDFPDISTMPFYDYPIDDSWFDALSSEIVKEFIQKQNDIEKLNVKTKILNQKYFEL